MHDYLALLNGVAGRCAASLVRCDYARPEAGEFGAQQIADKFLKLPFRHFPYVIRCVMLRNDFRTSYDASCCEMTTLSFKDNVAVSMIKLASA
jgi:hypothetical protein